MTKRLWVFLMLLGHSALADSNWSNYFRAGFESFKHVDKSKMTEVFSFVDLLSRSTCRTDFSALKVKCLKDCLIRIYLKILGFKN